MVIGKMLCEFLPIMFKNIGYWHFSVPHSANNTKNIVTFAFVVTFYGVKKFM